MMTPGVIRVLVVDDHTLYRDGARGILGDHDDIEVVGDADSGEMALALVNQLAPDVVLMDIRLPGINGIETTRRIRAHHPSVQVLMVSAYEDDEYVRAALEAGATGYLCKTAPSRELTDAVRAIAGGGSVVKPDVLARLVASTRPSASTPLGLTDREQAVLELLALGLQNKQIATRLAMSTRTVERHCDNIYAKFAVHSRTEAVLWALGAGLVRKPHAHQ